MEKSDEISGRGNSSTTYFRELDSRLGRWMSIDPVSKTHESPYAWNTNDPLSYFDPLGADSTERAQLMAAARQYVSANPGGTYGFWQKIKGKWSKGDGIATVDHIKNKERTIDCSGLIRNSYINLNWGDPFNLSSGANGSDGEFYQNGVAVLVGGILREVDDQDIIVGAIVTMRTQRGDHKGPDGQFDHIAIVSEVERDADGKVVAYLIIDSGGSGSSSGPREKRWVYLDGKDPRNKYIWHTGAYRFDSADDSEIAKWNTDHAALSKTYNDLQAKASTALDTFIDSQNDSNWENYMSASAEAKKAQDAVIEHAQADPSATE